ncbi:MAG: hypothetical protein LBO03_06055 [Acidaminococcales bacterium]|jgi:hypothetical protein|nr:hypothetical protein [Acidaminococcales bacterium]
MPIRSDSPLKIIGRFLLAAGLVSLPFVIAASLMRKFAVSAALAAGFAAGAVDNAVMLGGIARSSRKSGAKAFALMKRNMFLRVAIAGAVCFPAIKAGINMFWFFLAFCLVHVVCLVFVVIIAREGAKLPGRGKE